MEVLHTVEEARAQDLWKAAAQPDSVLGALQARLRAALKDKRGEAAAAQPLEEEQCQLHSNGA